MDTWAWGSMQHCREEQRTHPSGPSIAPSCSWACDCDAGRASAGGAGEGEAAAAGVEEGGPATPEEPGRRRVLGVWARDPAAGGRA